MEFSTDNLLKTAYDTALWPVRQGWRIASGAGSITLRLTLAAAKGAVEPVARLIDTDPEELQAQMPFHEARAALLELEWATDRSGRSDPDLQGACLSRAARAVVSVAKQAPGVPDAKARAIIETATGGLDKPD